MPQLLTPLFDSASVVARYADTSAVPQTSYATVRDFCDSADYLSQITRLDGDLKNVQRPWAVKALLGCIPPPARVLEIGGGEPIVSNFLAALGYDVTLVDPYDGSGNGPTDYERYRKTSPNIRIVRGYLLPEMEELRDETFHAIFSISVLEHLTAEMTKTCFDAITRFLELGGLSVHCFDFILQGAGEDHDRPNAERLLAGQATLSATAPSDLRVLISRLTTDVETFFLSPQGHHHWRGGKPYDEFPFRKVVSLQTIARRAV